MAHSIHSQLYYEATNGPNNEGLDQHAFYEITFQTTDNSDRVYVGTRHGRITMDGRTGTLGTFPSMEAAQAAAKKKVAGLKGYHPATKGETGGC